MFKAFKLVIKKWFVWLMALPPIIGSLKFYFPEKNNFLSKLIHWVSDNQIVLLLFILTIAIFAVLVEVIKKSEIRTVDKPKKNLKPLPANFELEKIQNGNYEWIFKVGRYFNPESTPEKDRFVDAIEMSKTRCVLCNSDIKKNVSFGHYGRDRGACCPNKVCKLHKKPISESELEHLEGQTEIQFISTVRKDFEKYWKIYCDEYKNRTKGKYDNYVSPIRKLFYKT